jgi:alkaline phosphatase
MGLLLCHFRIDHASHANRTDFVFQEVLELDQTV